MTDECRYRGLAGYCHRCLSFGECGEGRLANVRIAMRSPTTPKEWVARYGALLAIGSGLTAREWSHYKDMLQAHLTERH